MMKVKKSKTAKSEPQADNKKVKEEARREKLMEELRKGQQLRHEKGDILLRNIKMSMKDLEKLFAETGDHWGLEDPFYRFYHHSFKVYWVQGSTWKIVVALQKLSPWGLMNWDIESYLKPSKASKPLDEPMLHPLFEEIIKHGASGVSWEHKHNVNWSKNTRPFLEAFFHARQFLSLAIHYGKNLRKAPELLPSGWAALLTLYGIR